MSTAGIIILIVIIIILILLFGFGIYYVINYIPTDDIPTDDIPTDDIQEDDETLADLEKSYKWSDWGTCTKECGGGKQLRYCIRGNCEGPSERECNTQDCLTSNTTLSGWDTILHKYMVRDSITGWNKVPLTQCTAMCENNPNCNAVVYGLPAMYGTFKDKTTKGSCRLHSKMDPTYITNSENYLIAVPK